MFNLRKIFSIEKTPEIRILLRFLGIKLKIKYNNIKFVKEQIDNFYKSRKCPKILLITHELSVSGAPKVALLLAKTIKDLYGIPPFVISPCYGPMIEDFKQSDIPIEVVGIFDSKKLESLRNNFDLIIVNSWAPMLFDKYKQNLNCPILWWFHEDFSNSEYKNLYKSIKKVALSVDEVLSGSPVTQETLKQIDKKIDSELFLYGIENVETPSKEVASVNPIKFILPAAIQRRKGQDILLDAINKLPRTIREMAEFRIIGKFDEDFEEEVRKKAVDNQSIKFIDVMPINELIEKYQESHCVVIPSRYDPMPIVATYGFMLKKPVIISDVTGTSKLIKNMETGVVFESGNSNQLSKILEDVIDNYSKYRIIGENGYSVYENYFAMDTFREKLKNKLGKYIEKK